MKRSMVTCQFWAIVDYTMHYDELSVTNWIILYISFHCLSALKHVILSIHCPCVMVRWKIHYKSATIGWRRTQYMSLSVRVAIVFNRINTARICVWNNWIWLKRVVFPIPNTKLIRRNCIDSQLSIPNTVTVMYVDVVSVTSVLSEIIIPNINQGITYGHCV